MAASEPTTSTPPPIAVGIHGAAGRMGLQLIRLTLADPALKLAAAIDRPSHSRSGEDIGVIHGLGTTGVRLADGIGDSRIDVIIDFSSPAATRALAEVCRTRRIPMVIGTTGLESEDFVAIDRASETIPVLVAPNMSRAVNLLMKLAGLAAKALADAADIEIVERHHNQKKDSPSGTALRLGEVVAEAARTSATIYGRQGIVGARPKGELGIHAVRAGDNPGEHTVIFGMPGEVIELTHRAYNRDGFAGGALDAAKFLQGKPPGRYSIGDMLNL